jgi:hypothetical protein
MYSRRHLPDDANNMANRTSRQTPGISQLAHYYRRR